MTKAEARRLIDKRRKELNNHNYRYYVLNQPVISDFDYDRLLKQLTDLEKQFPELVTPDSPTQRVGGEPLKSFKAFEHKRPMLSLDNTYSTDEVREFDRRVSKVVGSAVGYEVTLKVDGVAVALHYRAGRFVLGATRGD